MQETAENMYALLGTRDAEIAALRGYVAAVEEELREIRGEEGHAAARERADELLRQLRYEHGFKSDGRWRGVA
jgi:hypothetical protein